MPASPGTQSLRSRTPRFVALAVLCIFMVAPWGGASSLPGAEQHADAVRVAGLLAPSAGPLQLARHNACALVRAQRPGDVKYGCKTMESRYPDRLVADFRDAMLKASQPWSLPVAPAGACGPRARQAPPPMWLALLPDAVMTCSPFSLEQARGVTMFVASSRAGESSVLADRAPMPVPQMAPAVATRSSDFWRSFLSAARGVSTARLRSGERARLRKASEERREVMPANAVERAPASLADASIARPTGGLRLPEREVDVAPPPAPRRASVPTHVAQAPIEVPTPKAVVAGAPATDVAVKPAPSASPKHTLSALRQSSSDSRFQLALSVNGRVDFAATRRVAPLRYELTLPDTALGDDCPPRLDVTDPLVDHVEASVDGTDARVSVFLKDRAACSAYQLKDGGRIVAIIRSVPTLNADAVAAAEAAQKRVVERPAAKASAPAEASPAKAPAEKPESKSAAPSGPSMLAIMAQAAKAGAAEAPVAEKPGLIDVHFYNADITEILSALARYSNKNIIASSSVTGTLTVSLSQVTLDDALDLITKLQGYDYILRGDNTYVVGTPEELANIEPPPVAPVAPPREYTYTTQNVTTDDIVAYFDTLKAVRETNVVAVPNSNTVIFVGIPDSDTEDWIKENLKRVDVPKPPLTVLQQLDNITAVQAKDALAKLVPEVVATTAPPALGAQVLQLTGSEAAISDAQQALGVLDVPPEKRRAPAEPVVQFKTLDYLLPEDVQSVVTTAFPNGIEVIPVSGGGGGGVETIGTGDVDEMGGLTAGGTLLLRGEKQTVDAVSDFIAQLDVPPTQVELKTTITEIGLASNTDLGFVWQLPGISLHETTVADGWKFGTFERDKMDFTSTFLASLERKRTKILASPKVVTLDKKTGSILVGSIIPYEVTVAGEGTVSRSVQLQEIGLGVEFTPVVHSDDSITMYLNPHVSTFTGFTPQGYPEVSTREAKTILLVNDGDTIVIGGLLQDEELVTKAGIPFLKDWPIIGELFTSRKKNRTKTEIVIIAEVKLLKPGSPATAEAAVGAPGPG